jgi:hypothetical protein
MGGVLVWPGLYPALNGETRIQGKHLFDLPFGLAGLAQPAICGRKPNMIRDVVVIALLRLPKGFERLSLPPPVIVGPSQVPVVDETGARV